MSMDTISLSTDYDDFFMTDSGYTSSPDEGAGGGDVGTSLSRLNSTTLGTFESVVTDVWESTRERTPGVQLYEACVLLLSALVVGVHGILGLLPRSLLSPWLTPRTAWLASLLLHAGLALGCLYGLACLLIALHDALRQRLFRNDEDADEEEDEAEEEGNDEDVDEKEGDTTVPAVVENIVSAQLEKEERVQRWIDNLVPDREQVNLEACGEMEGRNMEAESSSVDLLGDGQPAEAENDTGAVSPRRPRLLPLPPPPMPPAEVASAASLNKEARRALSLAYELSLAVRRQTSGNIRATLSAPTTPTPQNDAWGVVPVVPVVPRGMEVPPVPCVPAVKSPVRDNLERPLPARTPTPFPATQVPDTTPQHPALTPSTDTGKNTANETPDDDDIALPPSTPATTAATTPPSDSSDGPLNTSASLLNFVRRFSGTRFLLKELASAASATAEGLRLRDSRSLSLQLEQSPRPSPPVMPRAETITTDKSDVLKVFSKGILSEAFPVVPDGALGLLAQEAVNLTRTVRTSTTATCTTDSEAFTSASITRSSLNLNSRSQPEDLTVHGLAVTTSRGLTANMSEEGIPRPAGHAESLFDMKKSPLTSIPEVAQPDEDLAHYL